MRPILILLVGSLITSIANADGWELHVAPKGDAQAATCTVSGTGPEGPAKATLVIHHNRGRPLKIVKNRSGTELPILIELCVNDSASVKGIDFYKFEGPDAPAGSKSLIAMSIETSKEHFSKKFRQTGFANSLRWLLPEGGINAAPANESADFTFGIGDPEGNVKDYIAITNLLQKSPTKVEVIVTDFTNPKHTLRFNFATGNVGEIIGKLMQ